MKRNIWRIIAVIGVLGFFGCALFLFGQLQEWMELKEMSEYGSVVETDPPPGAAVEMQGTSEESLEESEAPKVDIPVDFAALQEKGPDIYAWIEIPGTDISYPIVQHPTDNSFYLRRSPDGDDFTGGSIFTEYYNSKDFTDPNTLIYGHCMHNGTMFAELHNFADADFFEENHEIIIYTPTQKLTYEVFACYPFGDQHLLFLYDFSDEEVFVSYLEGIFRVRDMHAQFNTEIPLDADSRIITLSTCMQDDNTRRFLVQAVLTKTEMGK